MRWRFVSELWRMAVLPGKALGETIGELGRQPDFRNQDQ